MTTFGEKLLAEFDEARAQLDTLSYSAYEPSQVRDVLSTLGAKTEIFLKGVALPGRKLTNPFHWFIDELQVVPIDKHFIDKLHGLRKKYNDAKHDPKTTMPLLDAVRIVEDARTAITEIVAKGAGTVDVACIPNPTRVYWIAAWDHFIGGDCEVHVILPAKSEHWLGPPTVDVIYVDISEWNAIATNLSRIGPLRRGTGLIPDAQIMLSRAIQTFTEHGYLKETIVVCSQRLHSTSVVRI